MPERRRQTKLFVEQRKRAQPRFPIDWGKAGKLGKDENLPEDDRELADAEDVPEEEIPF